MENSKQDVSLIQVAPAEYARMAEDCEWYSVRLMTFFDVIDFQDELPKAVKVKLDADIQQAQSIAIVVRELSSQSVLDLADVCTCADNTPRWRINLPYVYSGRHRLSMGRHDSMARVPRNSLGCNNVRCG
jgi:hypothetical protein